MGPQAKRKSARSAASARAEAAIKKDMLSQYPELGALGEMPLAPMPATPKKAPRKVAAKPRRLTPSKGQKVKRSARATKPRARLPKKG